MPNDSIAIQTSTTTGIVGGQIVTFYSSILTISEIGAAMTRSVVRACSANVVYQEASEGRNVTRVFNRAVTATKSITIRGWYGNFPGKSVASN
jgi:hypothetical protein